MDVCHCAQLNNTHKKTCLINTSTWLNHRPLLPRSRTTKRTILGGLLTPSHLLALGRTGTPPPPPSVRSGDDQYRRRWRYIQCLVNPFWRRWTREYLPTVLLRNVPDSFPPKSTSTGEYGTGTTLCLLTHTNFCLG